MSAKNFINLIIQHSELFCMLTSVFTQLNEYIYRQWLTYDYYFSKRDSKIRVISARPMSKNERSFYEKHTKV